MQCNAVENNEWNECLFIKIQGPLSQARLDIIDVAFNKMDKTGDGVVTVADLLGTYDVSRHPKFISGEKSKEQIVKKYMDVFQSGNSDDEVLWKSIHRLLN